ncbi:hypothetical protein GCM10022261_05830 [Brevibacterium daeguense]|uniref:TRAP-type C4-dicarboxylate transport system substrate-binding protein n=1 Tax=Brevibacterium daeguense TaxID=909936 RepID=A0ABP8EGF8_9MICO|nr:TRAP transporter substrate-binding protein DctP [Brevibacterium daeguense]
MSHVQPSARRTLGARTRPRRAWPAAAALGLVTVASGCGAPGGEPDGGDTGGTGSGFAYGASQEEVDAALAELEPVTITYQPSAASAESIIGPNGTDIKEAIETRSGGKITVDVVWGQAIAGYAEIDDALADGRVDLAFTLPSYAPAEYPAFDSIGTAMATLPDSPVTGELVTNAAGVQAGWETPEVLAEYEEKDLVPLIPVLAGGGYSTMCSEPMTSLADWEGTQVRIGSAAASEQVQNLGGSPVSLSFPETYEALQRGTVDCDLGQLAPNVEAGTFEVAPHLGYTTDAGIARAAGAYVAGQTYRELPLAYQQVIFDSMSTAFSTMMEVVIGAKAVAVEDALAGGGSVEAFDPEVQQAIAEHAGRLTAETAESAGVPGVPDRLTQAAEVWQTRVDELGYREDGDFAELPDWYPTDADYDELGQALFDEVMGPHRPE